MKKMIFAMIALMTMTVKASAMSYEQARNEALFLTDKMAYELNLTDAQYEAAYEINLDYLMNVSNYNDVFGTYWERRNMDLSYILYSWQWEAFRAATYFYRPLYWDAGYWHFAIYARYPHRDYFYFGRPHFYATYRGGHSWHMNGGRSYYHSRADHFRPAIASGRQHFGMRNSFDRGDYRGSHRNSSTRVTAGQPGGPRNDRNMAPSNRSGFGASRPANGAGSNMRPQGDNMRQQQGSNMRPQGDNMRPQNGSSMNSNRSFSNSRGSEMNRSNSSGSFGASRSNSSGSFGASRSNNSGSFGGSRSSSGMGASRSSAPTRSSSSGSFGGGSRSSSGGGGASRSSGSRSGGFGAHR